MLEYLPYVVAAGAILAALLLVTITFRAVAGGVKGRRGSRLGISEYREIDKQRRLVLVRRDDVEHLLLIGGGQDVVVETSIGVEALRQEEEAPAGPRLRAADRLGPDDEERQSPGEARQEPVVVRPVPLRAAPRPAVFGDRAPVEEPPTRAEPRLQPVAKGDDGREA